MTGGWRARAGAALASWADSPSVEHEERTLLSAPKVAVWLSLEAAVVVAFTVAALVVLPADEPAFAEVIAALGTGRCAAGAAQLAVLLFASLVVPLRAVGLLEGPRWRGYLDQVATTGISPARYFGGKWLANQPFFGGLLLGSFPLVLLAGLLGDAPWGEVAAGYALIYAYCNVLLLVTFALGVLFHEALALLMVLGGTGCALLLEFAPAPSAIAAWTPLRFWLAPAAVALGGADAELLAHLYGGAHLFGVEVPWLLWIGVVWAGAVALAAVPCALGPLHVFAPGVNNFGAVVLPGDGKRAFFRRLRPILTRRVDVAFLFQNRPPWLDRWHLPIRTAHLLALLVGAAAAGFAALFDPWVVERTPLELIRVLHGVVAGSLLLGAAYVFGAERNASLAVFRLGPWRLPKAALDLAAMVLFTGAVVALQAIAFVSAWEALPRAPTLSGAFLAPEDLLAHANLTLAVLIVLAAGTFLVVKLVSVDDLGDLKAAGVGLGFVFTVTMFPFGALALAMDGARRGEDVPPRVVAVAAAVAQLSPATPIAAASDFEAASALAGRGLLAERGYWVWHGLFLTCAAALVVLSQGQVVRESRLRAARASGAAAPPGAPCAECGSSWVAPAMYCRQSTAAPWALGLARCLDCRATLRTATGRPPGVALSAVVAGEVLVALAALGVLLAWATS